MILSSLDAIRPLVKTGDPFVYGAARGPGQWIEGFTDSDQSHVSFAVVQGPMLLVVESTIKGAKVRPVTKNFKKAADMWWLPLSSGYRESLDMRALLAYLADICERQVPYDFRALRPGVWRNGRPPEDFSRLYCSELVALGLRKGGLYRGTVELTPIEVCRLIMYAPDYHCIKWDADGPKKIDGYNTIPSWNNSFSRLAPAF